MAKRNDVTVYNNKTAEKIRKLEEKKAELIEKRNALNNQIKKADAELAALNEQWRNEKIAALLDLSKKKGISIDDLFEAVQNGDSELWASITEKDASDDEDPEE